VAITFAVIGATVGEFVGAEKGLGYLIQNSIGNLNTKQLFASIMGLSALGIALFFAVETLERVMLPWHTSRRIEEL
jgi:NitT/TauT family transport system permease protein